MNRFLPALRIALFLTVAFPCATAADRPNLVVFLADDQGWGDLSMHGNTNLATPRIDSLAKDGAMFERFYVCPVCSPTRAEFLTGRYHPRGGVRDVSTGGERLNLEEKTIADTFKAAGYATGAFGKWHNGTQWPYHPNARGFDEYYGFTSGHWGSYFSPLLDHNGQLTHGDGYLADDLTNHALRFIEEHREEPFFCYLPYNVPHSPMQVPDRWFQKFDGVDLPLRNRDPQREDLVFTRAALAMCENMDWNVGRVLDLLKKLDLAEKTIVVYFSDNGPNSWRWNGGLRGKKGLTDEGGVRSPLVIRWPGKIEAGQRIPRMTAAIDLLPTLVDLTGVKRVGDQPLDGRSLKPLLDGSSGADWPDRMIFSHWNRKISVHTQTRCLDEKGRLYDLAIDPGQDRDIAPSEPELAAKLTKAVDEWRAEMMPLLREDERPLPVGYREFPMTQLPARDGRPHGKIKRSAGAPNCSYFTNWTQPSDTMTWDLEVATPCRYAVDIYYACAAADLGAEIELSFRNSRCTGTLANTNDPPLLGAENDRFPRQSESYVKDFKPWRIGEIDLAEGRGELTLRARKIPGHQAMEVRLITLTLLP
ncbi:MAG: arylsulfatase [Chthoniobacteraceae bacterium]